jgi:hypothetical protein
MFRGHITTVAVDRDCRPRRVERTIPALRRERRSGTNVRASNATDGRSTL